MAYILETRSVMAAEHQTDETATTDKQDRETIPIDSPETNGHLVRVGGVSAILGSIVMFLSLMIRPRTAPADPVQKTLQTYADEVATFDVHALGLFIGILLLLGGFVGLRESLRDESGIPAAWGQLGLVAAVVMTTMGVIFTILDARVMSRVAQAWVDAPAAEETATLSAARGIYILDIVMVSRLHTLMALTFFLFGIAIWQSDSYHRWLGWSGVALGAVGVVLGLHGQVQGIAPRPARLRVGVALIALFAWFVVVGVSMWRASGATPQGDSNS